MSRPPLPPLTAESAVQKVRMAGDGWNGRNPQAVTLAYEWHDGSGSWIRSYGNENWEFHWPLGRRPDAHPGLSELGL